MLNDCTPKVWDINVCTKTDVQVSAFLNTNGVKHGVYELDIISAIGMN